MGDYKISSATATTGTNPIISFTVDPVSLYTTNAAGETEVTFPYATKYWGYYKQIPELKKAIDSLAVWAVGKGYSVETPEQQNIVELIAGVGSDSFQSIMENMIVTKKVQGDAFAEIVRDADSGKIVNLKPISPERMTICYDEKGLIKKYVYKSAKKDIDLEPEEVLHLVNDRVGDELRGVSVIDACKWVIDARNQAMSDYKIVLHNNIVPFRILEFDSDDTAKRDLLITEYKDAIANGEVLVLPKGVASISDNKVVIENPIEWINYLENFFYQAVGVPRVIASSGDYSEASSKVGYLTFEPVYTREQTILEEAIWDKMGIRIKFNRPPSIGGVLQSSEAKNTGQVGIQPSDIMTSMNRNNG